MGCPLVPGVVAGIRWENPMRAPLTATFFLLALDAHSFSVTITSPTNHAILESNAYVITISAESPRPVRFVDFYANGIELGHVTNAPFSLHVTNAAARNYELTAHAVDENFFFANSAPVYVQVGNPPVGLAFGPYLQSVSATNIVVRWQTDWFVDSLVRYGTNPAALDRAATNLASVIEHEMTLTKLTPDTTYYYSIGSATNLFASGPGYYFHTAPIQARPLRIWAIGDSGTADQYAAAVRDAYLQNTGTNRTDAWLMLGDNSYTEGVPHRFRKDIFSVYPQLLRNTVLWPAVGNHDVNDAPDGDTAPHLAAFTLPKDGSAGGVPSGTEMYYSFDYANLHVVCLDSMVSERTPESPMMVWLRNDLASTDKDWIIAYWHHPPYSFSSHHSDMEAPSIEMRQFAGPILEEYGADLVLCGHNHDYERSFLIDGHYGFSSDLQPSMVLDSTLGRIESAGPYAKPAGGMGSHRGTVYVVCGCSGQGGAEDDFPGHPVMAVTKGGFGSVVIQISNLQLTASFLRSDGETDDHFTIDKRMDSTNTPPLAIGRDSDGAVVSWQTSKPVFTLEATDGVPGTNWQAVTGALQTNGRRNLVRLLTDHEKRFFRLRPPP
jgi:hypothetical protein